MEEKLEEFLEERGIPIGVITEMKHQKVVYSNLNISKQ